MDNLFQLPADLPVPIDDGGCDHLPGMTLPPVALLSTSGGTVNVAELKGTTILYAYPRTGRPGEPLPAGWDDIPGARGCTPEACGFRDHHVDLRNMGARVLGLSTQESDYQREVVERLQLPFEILSHSDLALTQALRLPTFAIDGLTLLKRLTLIVRDARIEHVFYPVFPPDAHAEEVGGWLIKQAPL